MKINYFCNMIIRNKHRIAEIKQNLIAMLKEERAFWSYDVDSIKSDVIGDEQLIALTMRHLDLSEIKLLFSIYSFKKIKSVWRNLLVPEGEYLYTLNRFFAWYYFKAKSPDSYLKSLQTRHLNKFLN